MITMQGLWALYDHTGRRAAWAALVAEVVPAFLNPTTDDPLPGREPQWSQVTEYRVRLAEEARDWATAARLQRLRVDWNRALAAPALTLPPAALDRAGRNAIRSLAVSVSGLGDALREQGSPECIGLYEEDYTLSLLISDEPGAAITAYNLGRAYQEVSALRDLEAAERWYRCSLELRASDDRLGRSVTIDQIGAVLYDRFSEARESGVPSAELVKYAEGAIRAYQQSLECAPPNALRKLGLSHQHLANMLAAVGRFDSAFMHYRESIRHLEASNDFYMAGATRLGVAVALAQIGRFHDALLYARAALANFAIYGKRAAAEVQRTEELIARIERDQGGGGTAGG